MSSWAQSISCHRLTILQDCLYVIKAVTCATVHFYVVAFFCFKKEVKIIPNLLVTYLTILQDWVKLPSRLSAPYRKCSNKRPIKELEKGWRRARRDFIISNLDWRWHLSLEKWQLKIRLTVSAGFLRLSSLGPSSALGEKGQKKKKKKRVKQEKICEPPHQSFRLFLHCWALLQLDMPMTAFCPFTEYTFYDIFRESGLASFTFFSGKTRHCCVHRWPMMEVKYKHD